MTYSDLVFKCEMDKGIEESRQHYERMMFKEALRTAFFEYQAARDRYREKCMDGMHIDLVMRFVETQTLILSPICPHICEYIWHTLLKKKKLIVCESWPIVGQPDKLLLRSAAYLDDAAHEFRLRTKEFIQTKRSKPTHAVIWVAKTYPPWQNLILTKLRSIYDRKKELPDNKSISTELGREETLEKRMKKVMPFVIAVKENFTKNGVSAFNSTLDFDEKLVLEGNLPYLHSTLELEGIEVRTSDEADDKIMEECCPGKPFIVVRKEVQSLFVR